MPRRRVETHIRVLCSGSGRIGNRRIGRLLSVGSAAGVGSDDHLVLLGLEEAANIRALHAPFNGTAQVQRDLLSGAVDIASFNMSEGIVLMREGRIRCLAQASPTRWSAAAQVPTFRELGFDVREEPLGDTASGEVRIGSGRHILLNVSDPPSDQLKQLTEILKQEIISL